MNAIGARTLLEKEVRRFMRVPGQTVLQPLVSTTLYFVVFGYSFGERGRLEGVPYAQFLVPGLVFLGVANNAFLNASSSIFITKIQGTIVDLLVAPLGPVELLLGFIGGAMTRGLLVGVLTWFVGSAFAGWSLADPLVTLAYLLLGAYVFGVLGLLAGIWAEKFEQVNFFPTFLILPLTFLGGVFSSIDALPEPLRTASHFNPVVPMVVGLRAGMLGTPGNTGPGLVLLVVTAVAATLLTARLLALGYRLKA